MDLDTDADATNGIEDENVNGVTASDTPPERRPSFHGDVVHSRPVAINMGTDASREVVVFYGGNDGVLRAVNGNRGEPTAQPIAGIAAGDEMWAFMAPEFFPHIKRLRDNLVPINFFGNTFPAAGSPSRTDSTGRLTAYQSGSNLVAVRVDAAGRPDDLFLRRLDDRHRPHEPDAQVAEGLPQPGRQHGLHDGARGDRPDLEHTQSPEGARLHRRDANGAADVDRGRRIRHLRRRRPEHLQHRSHSHGQPDLRARRRHGRKGEGVHD